MLDKLLGVLIQYLTQYVRLYSVFTSGLSDANYEDVGGDEITGWCDGDGDDDGVDGDGDDDGVDGDGDDDGGDGDGDGEIMISDHTYCWLVQA